MAHTCAARCSSVIASGPFAVSPADTADLADGAARVRCGVQILVDATTVQGFPFGPQLALDRPCDEHTGTCKVRPRWVGTFSGCLWIFFGPQPDGTYALRLKGGPQFTEINMPSAALWQNQQVAEAIRAELNKGVKPDMVSSCTC